MGERIIRKPEVRRKRRRRKPPIAAFLIVAAVAVLVGVIGGRYLAHTLGGVTVRELFQRPFAGKRYVRILMLGEDNTGNKKTGRHGLSDTLVVMAIDLDKKEVRAITIPRDTRTEIPGHGTCKINAANAFGGPELARSVIQNLLGVDIDYYIATSPKGLRGLVDSVGGVYIIVDENMNYDDNHQDLHIHLRAKPDKQLLNGHDAEGYVRFRHDRWGDSGWKIVDGKKVPAGRTSRQQYFMRALVNRILAMPTKRQRLAALNNAYEKGFIVSDLKIKDWDGLSDMMKDIDPNKISMAMLPGAPGTIGHGRGAASYWLPDDSKIADVVNKQMRFVDDTGDVSQVSIEVLNGCGIAGAAGKVADKLQKAGYQVTKQGNAPGFNYDKCCVIARNGNVAGAQKIASLLNCANVQEQPKSKGSADITVIVGRDYSNM